MITYDNRLYSYIVPVTLRDKWPDPVIADRAGPIYRSIADALAADVASNGYNQVFVCPHTET